MRSTDDQVRHAQRADIKPFIVMDVMARAEQLEREGRSIVHMEVGQPGTPAPEAARVAAKRMIDEDLLGYTHALGIAPLRSRIARLYREWYDLEVPAERVVITVGSSSAFTLAFLALFDVADRVLLPAPGYPCYETILRTLGLDIGLMPLGPETDWCPTVDMIERAGAFSGVLLASPSNPTGKIIPETRLGALIAATERAGATFISDEIYHGLHYETPAQTALAFSNDVFVINSFSKYFSMTGWRVGWMVVPDAFVRPVERLAQNMFISAPAVSQYAALGAFDGMEELEALRDVYGRNRDALLKALPECGFTSLVPADGAFYIYADVSSFGMDSADLAHSLLEDAGLAVTPGHDFDGARGHQFLRFSYARDHEMIQEGIARLRAWSKAR